MKITKDIGTFIKKFPTNFVAVLTKKNGAKNGFSSVNLTNFANFLEKNCQIFDVTKLKIKNPTLILMNMSNSYVSLTNDLD
jgi:hypothetical protein